VTAITAPWCGFTGNGMAKLRKAFGISGMPRNFDEVEQDSMGLAPTGQKVDERSSRERGRPIMTKHSVKLLACIGVFGAAVLADNHAQAMTNDECEQLSGNMYLAAIERGECDVTIQTATGPDVIPITEPERPQRTRDSRGEGKGGGGNDGGGNRGGGNPGGGRAGGPNRP
jgi:uncharacterized membrane protein YgcG